MGLLRCSIAAFAICLAGCLANRTRTDISPQIQVFGIELYSAKDYREITGVAASEEPCLKGYERSFDALDITIGYGFDKKIRKITTRNPGTGIFGISPGITALEGDRLARQVGLEEVAPFRFQGREIYLTLLVDGNGKIFGITVESRD